MLAYGACFRSGRARDAETQSPASRGAQTRLNREDRKTVHKYINKLRELNNVDGLSSNVSPAKASRTLLRLSKNGVKLIPKKEQTTLHRKYFVDCWSITMVALDAHLHMVSEVAKHPNGLGSKEW